MTSVTAAGRAPMENTSDSGVIRGAHAISRGFASWCYPVWARAKTIRTLEALDDRMLADIGLKRDQIAGIHRDSRYIRL